jgi:hypothetical protein
MAADCGQADEEATDKITREKTRSGRENGDIDFLIFFRVRFAIFRGKICSVSAGE